MALNKNGMDLKAIRRDQKAIDKLPNRGRTSVNHAKSKALDGAKHETYAQKMQREHAAMQHTQYAHKDSLSAHNEREKDIENFRKAFKKQK